MSKSISITDGAVQGSILRVMDHNAVLEEMDDHIDPESNCYKYVDGATLVETIKKEEIQIQDDNELILHEIKTEGSFSEVERRCDEKFCHAVTRICGQ